MSIPEAFNPKVFENTWAVKLGLVYVGPDGLYHPVDGKIPLVTALQIHQLATDNLKEGELRSAILEAAKKYATSEVSKLIV